MPMSHRDERGRFVPVTPESPGDVTLFERIRELERRCDYWRTRSHDLRRSRDLWKHRAMVAERKPPRRKMKPSTAALLAEHRKNRKKAA